MLALRHTSVNYTYSVRMFLGRVCMYDLLFFLVPPTRPVSSETASNSRALPLRNQSTGKCIKYFLFFMKVLTTTINSSS